MDRISQHLDKFLTEHHEAGRPVLLGFSGGPDSTAMLYALKALERKHLLNPIVVHVDHAWRKESEEEADVLRERVEKLGFRCFIHRLMADASLSNREEKARGARIEIFKKVYREHRAQALILAHQAGDQAETVLKRIFEGSGISAWSGMRPTSFLEGMNVWRPYLQISKKELIEYCEKQGIPFLLDRTNEDPRYLRTRMRKEIVPAIEEHFGKKIETNLTRLADSSYEIASYLHQKTRPVIDAAERGPWGIRLDLRNIHPLEAQFSVQEIAKNEGVVLGQQHLRHIVELLQNRAAPCSFFIANRKFLIDNGYLVLE